MRSTNGVESEERARREDIVGPRLRGFPLCGASNIALILHSRGAPSPVVTRNTSIESTYRSIAGFFANERFLLNFSLEYRASSHNSDVSTQNLLIWPDSDFYLIQEWIRPIGCGALLLRVPTLLLRKIEECNNFNIFINERFYFSYLTILLWKCI